MLANHFRYSGEKAQKRSVAIVEMKKILIGSMSLALMAVLMIGSTLAYFTDKTDAAKNEFHMDGLSITLKENAEVLDGQSYRIRENTSSGSEAGTAPVQGTGKGVIYTGIVPGATIAKNPYITVSASNARAYVYVYVEGISYDPNAVIHTEWAEGWAQIPASELSGTLLRREIAKDAAGDYDVFTRVYVNDNASGTETLNQITIGAFAHQADNVTLNMADTAAIAYFQE